MIHRLLGPTRPRTRIIVFGKPAGVKQAHASAHALIWLMMGAMWFLCGFGPPRLVDREIGPTVRVSVGELRAWSTQAETPELSAESYMLYDLGSGRTLFAHNSDVARAPASLTKLMTALLVLERAELDATVVVAPEDMVEGATMGLVVGDLVTVQDLLWGLLLPSGNDAASALARHVAGSAASFVDLMNARAQALGMRATHFVNPHGLDTEGHVSSAEDLLLLTQELWSYPLFRTMVATPSSTWNGRDLLTTNEWLYTFEGVTGVKTGTTDLAGECLIASVERDGRTILLVIMGSDSRYVDATVLYDAFERAYALQRAGEGDLSVINRVYADEGQVYYLEATGVAPEVLQPRAGVPPLRAYRRVEMPEGEIVSPGTHVGVIEWWVGAEQVGTQALVIR